MAEANLHNGRPSASRLPIPAPYGPAGHLPSAKAYVGAAYPEPPPPNESRVLLEYLRVLFESKGLLLLLAGAGLLAGLGFSYLQTPVFRSSATVELQGLNGDYLNLKAFDPTTVFQDFSPEAEILTQAKIMQRDALLDQVAATVKSRLAKDNTASQAALDFASEHVDVRLVPGTHIVELLCDSTDRQIATDFTNAWAEEYIKENREARVRTTQQTEDSLRSQLADVKAKLEKAEEDLLAYARTSNLMFAGEDQRNIVEEQLRQTQTAMSAAETERIAKQSAYELISAAPPDPEKSECSPPASEAST